MKSAARHLVLAASIPFLICNCCAAQVRVTFPLQGYYRPGKYMPVHVAAPAGTSAPVVLSADGAVAVSVGSGGAGINTVVPWLAAGELRRPRWDAAGGGGGSIDATLTPVEPGQVLVGIVSADVSGSTAAVADLFPGGSVVAVPLTGTPAMGGDPAAWEALDAVVFDEPDHLFLAELLGQGMSVVIRSDVRPGGAWAWRGGPGRWFVRFETAGPRGAIHPDAYAPASSWRPGWPAPLRRRAALLALVYCLVVIATTLWFRSRRAAVATVLVSFAAASGFAWWGTRQPMVCEASTGVTVSGGAGTQGDGWSYYRPLRRRDVAVEWSSLTKPVFASPRHLRETNLKLHVGAAGRPQRFTWRGEPGTTLAFLGRSFDSSTVGVIRSGTGPHVSPTRELVLQNYLAPGDVMTQESAEFYGPDDADWRVTWPAVTVHRQGG